MLKKEDFVNARTLSLKANAQLRLTHWCGEGNVLLVTHHGNKLSAWCFRCCDSGLHTIEDSLQDKLAKLVPQASDLKLGKALPEPKEYRVPEWPLEARVWLFKCGLTTVDIGLLGAYWCTRLQRVVLPLADGWTARAVSKELSPKYLSYVGELPVSYGDSDTLIITEDALSAYKVASRTGLQALALQGTYLKANALRLVMSKKTVILWLDPDKGGVTGVARLRAQLLFKELYKVTSERDPKYLCKREIEELLCRKRLI